MDRLRTVNVTTTDNDVPGLVVDVTDLTTNGGGDGDVYAGVDYAAGEGADGDGGSRGGGRRGNVDPRSERGGLRQRGERGSGIHGERQYGGGVHDTIGSDDGGVVLNRRLFLRCVGLVPAAFLGGVNLLSDCRSVLKAHPLCSEIPEDIQALYSPDFGKAFPDLTLCELIEKLFDK